MANKDADPKLTKRQSENVRARIAKKASELADALIEHALGHREMTPSQVKACQVTLDRVLPTMQAIDQTNHTETPDLTPEEIEAQLRAYVKGLDPAELMDLRADDPAREEARH